MERLWNRNYIKVLTGNFLMFFSFQLLIPLLPLYLTERFGANKQEIGMVLMGYAIAALVIRPFSGYLVDTFNRRKLLLIFYFVFAAFFSGYLFAGSILAFTVLRTLHGLPFGGATVANSTAAIDVLPSSRRAEGIGFYGLSGNIAMAIGPTIGLYLYHGTGNYNMIFILCLAASIIGLVVMTTVHGVHTNRSRQGIDGSKAPMVNKQQNTSKKPKASFDRFFLTVATPQAFSMVCFAFSYGIVSTYVAIYAQDNLGIKSGSGLFFTLLATGLILSRFEGAHALRDGKIAHNGKIGVMISAVGFLLFAMCNNAVLFYVSAFIIGLGNGHMFPAFQNMFIGMAPSSLRGTANSTILISWDVGIGLGILIGGTLAEHFSYQFAFWTAWAINIVGMLYFVFYGSRHYIKHRIG
ncbi:MAG: MFS transporter [Prevotellaceae bacterium]|nr:MFS transporter [Prevotellaceae bacterium]